LPEASDIKLRLGMRLVEGILLENSASPLRHYLETCGYANLLAHLWVSMIVTLK
jgi:Zn-dependent M16 (insulinase) family peptidase